MRTLNILTTLCLLLFVYSNGAIACDVSLGVGNLSASFPGVSKFRLNYLDDLEAHTILNANDRAKIDQFFRSEEVEQAIKMSYDLFLEKRVRRFGKHLASDEMDSEEKMHAVHASLSSVAATYVEMDFERVMFPYDAAFIPFENNIRLNVAKEFRNTIGEFATALHEEEHYLQNHLVNSVGSGKAREESRTPGTMFGMRVGHRKWELLQEAAAMLIEGEFYLAMPLAVREALVKRYVTFLKFPKTEPFVRQAHIMLTASNPADYVRRMWQNGRYNPEKAFEF